MRKSKTSFKEISGKAEHYNFIPEMMITILELKKLKF